MALTAIIQFGNNTVKRYFKEYLVTDCHIVHRRNYNKFCPEGNGACERLEVSVVCPGRDDLDLYRWYDMQTAQEGRIVISTVAVRASDGETEHIISFENARCFSLDEKYDINTFRRRIVTLSIEAENIKVDDIEFKRF
jgi:hypothetical protein